MENTKIKFEKDIPEDSIIKTQKVFKLDDKNYIIVGYFKRFYFCVADLQQKCVEKTFDDDTTVLEFIDQHGPLWFKKGVAKDGPDFSEFVLGRLRALSNQNLEVAPELQQQIKDYIIQLNTEETNDEEDETNVKSFLKNYFVPLFQCLRNQYYLNQIELRNRVRDNHHNINIPLDDIELRERAVIYEHLGEYRIMRAQERYVRRTIRGAYTILWDIEYPNPTHLINKFRNKEFGANGDYDIKGCILFLNNDTNIHHIINYFDKQILQSRNEMLGLE